MNTSNPTLAFPSRAPATAAPTRRVIDAPMRMFHWLFALCFVGAYASADGEHWRMLHVTLGYTLAGLLAFRLGYGLLGPRQARLSLLRRRLGGLSGWVSSLGTATPANVNWRKGQNLLMALALVALLAAVVPVTLSGYAIYNDFGGEWLEELHEFAGEAFLWLVLGHLALLLGLSVLRRRNQALPMLSGRIEGPGTDLAKRNHGVLALLLLSAVLVFMAWQWQESPKGLLPGYASASARTHSHDD